MADRPIHLPPSSVPHLEPSVTCPVWITQSSLDGMLMLLTFCQGMEAAGKGRIDGSFELTMFYRTLRSAIQDHLRPKTDDDEFVEVSEVP